MMKKIWIHMFIVLIGVFSFCIQAEAVERTPEYEFKLSRDKTYPEAKDPASYREVDIEYLVEMQKRCPQYVPEDGIREIFGGSLQLPGNIIADSITINGITCTLQPWNENDIIGQIEAFSKVYCTDIVELSGEEIKNRYQRGINVTREDLHRYVLWSKTLPDFVFENFIYFYSWNCYNSAWWKFQLDEQEVYFNFDDEKVRHKLTTNYWTEERYSNPYSEFMNEFTGGRDFIYPELEMNGQKIEYMGIVDINQPDTLPAYFAMGSKFGLVPVILGIHSDGSICRAIEIDCDTNYSESMVYYINNFKIKMSNCNGCTSRFKIAGIDIHETPYEVVKEKLQTFNVVCKSDYIEYSNEMLSYFYDYVYAKDKDNIVAEFDKLEINYTTVE